MTLREKNKNTIKYIRKCQAILEDFHLSVKGYSSILDETNFILENKDKINLSEEKKQLLISKTEAINQKIINWKEKIEQSPEKYLAIYFAKWLGLDYIYSLEDLYNRTFIYNNSLSVKGSEVSHAANKYLKEIIRIQKEMNLAREFLVSLNKKLILEVVKKTIGNRYDLFEDILSVANIQFIKCMDETYDINRNTEFSTYAYACMKASCQEALITYNDIISIPHYKMGERLDSSRKEIENPEQSFNNLTVNLSICPIDKIINREKDEFRHKEDRFLSDGNIFLEIQNKIILKHIIEKISQKLIEKNPKNKIKIKAVEYKGYFDFDNQNGELTLNEVAEKLYQNGYTETLLTRERVRQIINEGLNLIKSSLKRDYDLK